MEQNDILDKFEKKVDKHSLCPNNLTYNGNALAGEIGEVCNLIKKIEMSIIKPEWVTQNENSLPTTDDFRCALKGELGDALFYLTRVASDNGFCLIELIGDQAGKLNRQSKQYNRTFLK